MSRQTIAIDLDDVLAASAEGFSAFSNRRWGLRTKPEEYSEGWDTFWKVPLDRAMAWAKDFHESDAVYHYRHFEEALPVLKYLQQSYRLIIVTSRQIILKTYTEQWIRERFQGVFDAIHYAGIWDRDAHITEKLRQTKAELCRELEADYLIDDQPKHCAASQDAGVQALLFGDYAWNRNQPLPDGVVRVKKWAEVQEYFNAKS